MIVRLKGNFSCIPNGWRSCFNSMIVRLKEFPKVLHKCNIPKFQFYDSPIKSVEEIFMKHSYTSFNSMIVRLKEEGNIGAATGKLAFQFYDSPIKSFGRKR